MSKRKPTTGIHSLEIRILADQILGVPPERTAQHEGLPVIKVLHILQKASELAQEGTP